MPELVQLSDLTRENGTELVKTKREILADYVDKVVMKEPRGPERWKAAKRMALELNFSGTPGLSAKQENAIIEKQCADDRDFNYRYNNGQHKSRDKNSDLQGAFNWPYYVYMFIKMVDPDAFSKDNVPQLARTFPEYRVSERF